ncbi:MAG TPA: VWA domain-containing protein, partial [Euzebyales bacterium]|nr:VWA domain-containing protein [Euzebyales bacterium]
AAGGAQAPTLAIATPTAESIVSGPTPIEIAITPADAAGTISVYVNGRLVCTLVAAPFRCTWDPGPVVRGHHVRVVAELAGGRRLVANVRTKGLGYAERTRVDAVLVPVIVTDRGRFVRGLKKQDFQVLEEGVPQRLSGFADEDSPLELVLALDISGSMEQALAEVKDAARRFLARLRPDDAATIVGFNDTSFLVAERETDQQTREDALDLLDAWGGTALYDATARAVDLVGQAPGRKGLVVFSDGDDQHSLTPPDRAAARVQAGNAMLYSIGFGSAGTAARLRLQLEEYAAATGGRAFFPRRTADLDAVFTDIVTELANQYVLSYVSTNTRADGRWRAIRVRVRNGEYDVRARRGYQARSPQLAGRQP